jgi:hypothetical protein
LLQEQHVPVVVDQQYDDDAGDNAEDRDPQQKSPKGRYMYKIQSVKVTDPNIFLLSDLDSNLDSN